MAHWAAFLKQSALMSFSVASLLATGSHFQKIGAPWGIQMLALLPVLVFFIGALIDMTENIPAVRGAAILMSPRVMSQKTLNALIVIGAAVMAVICGVALAVGLLSGLQLAR